MLRQVILYHNQEIIFTHIFAQAYNKGTLDEVLTKKLVSYIQQPSQGQVFSKPLFDFQAHFGMFGDVFILYVTDMSDRPKIISKEVERAAKMLHKLFPNPQDLKNPSVQKEEFIKFINETHYYLHPKITLIGLDPSDRQKILDYLKINPEPDKRMMDFAVYHQIQIGNLFLDLWNFIINDSLSPLWSNYIRGSDMILFIIDGSNSDLNEGELKYFNSIRLREGKYSKAAIFLTHADNPNFIGEEALIAKFPFLEKYPIFKIELDSPDSKDQLNLIMKKALGLKQPLPPDFKFKLKQANDLVTAQKFKEAIDLIQMLIKVCEDYQEYNYIDVFQNKINELEQKLKEKQLQEEIERKKIKAPKKISFGKFHGAKTLPSKQGGKIVPDLSKLKKVAGKVQEKLNEQKLKEQKTNEQKTNEQKTNEQKTNEQKTNEQNLEVKPGKVLENVAEKIPSYSDTSSEKDQGILQDIDNANPFFGGLTSGSKKGGDLTPKKISKSTVEPESSKSKTDNPFFSGIPDVNLDSLNSDKKSQEKPISRNESVPLQKEPASSKTEEEGFTDQELEDLLREHDKIQDVSNDLDFFAEIQADHDVKKQDFQNQTGGVIQPSNRVPSQEKIPKSAVPPVEPGSSIDTFKIKNYSVEPIDLTGSRTPESHEKAADSKIQKVDGLKMQKKGFTRRKTLTFEPSPLVQGEKKIQARNIQKTKATPTIGEKNPLKKFTIQTSPLNPQKILTPAEKLEQLILIRGETLSPDLCEKFITQLKLKLKRTITDADIEKVAELYVQQKRRKRQGL